MTIRDLVTWGRGRFGVPARREDENPVTSLQRNINDMFDSFFADFPRFPGHGMDEWRGRFAPSIDVKEEDKEIEITAELPGMDENDIDVSITHEALVIKGEKKEEKEEEGKGYRHSERRYGSFQRVIPLPESIDRDKAEASFKKGVLSIRIPKTGEAETAGKKISIKTE
ncbi:MAG: Hsp20/alpha crystallin family protein [Syntrophales bacterium]|nr:Hsp20/alpha crystallin family protein [Syntrophales bacterium]MCK9527789.1 Hsp20/alpha crystallin family protein [Syntrophales bacterium]MDX9922114.1 Hsp20/alpha crystallin family protein [Syntrophales bacterium]